MARFDYIKAFYKAPHNRDALVADVDSLLGSQSRGIAVTCIPFGTEERPATYFPQVLKKSRKVRLLAEFDFVQLYELRYSFKIGSVKQSKKGRFFVLEHPTYANVFVALTIEEGDFARRGLLAFLRSCAPRIVVGFVPHTRLHRLLTDFRTSGEFSELIVTRASQRWRLPEEGTHRRVIPVVAWPSMALDEAFGHLLEHNGWFQSVKFDAKRDDHTAAEVSVSREGVISCDYLFGQVFQAFVLPICKMNHENFNLFSRRARRDNPGLDVRPLAITFDMGQFDNVEENHKFIRALRTMRASSVSVLHGNPYIHISVIDYSDGSIFDVWVVDSNSLIIVPQMYASVGAIKRLVNHVFDTYAEGEVTDFVAGKT